MPGISSGFHDGTSNTMDMVHEGMVKQAREANKAVLESLSKLNEKSDDPALLADMRHRSNIWSNVFQVDATLGQTFKNTISSILQKF
ncbi:MULTISPECIES: EscF/YscF/HrpA family type III secretion system needle major subunit [unclassified Pseudomonas]|uniref:EscF/YscF/HrpA family type III secretion system needle major subunit n=1 Tax=unclassified Pseudomonas TaxID=196821 RepID=UPI000C88E7F6|nr:MULTISPECIES: EscF/YscF/HrpA family type III secretion system needle major subunit [unclassified Pseudomonas]PMZ90499.1 EscF/YscF/HrpA family type III secretion system needle major subunit [Pseudomonas sp. FW305-42]PNA21243.1 EscF/YscF/HrpA family type III secretion system needle major subunit [Pseudomonas sp. MPR-R1B]PNB26725.1 EscF/YscF/HrpA family type III secretion system needle major subunit [Pseudomonas sp. DP16D-E2]PNB43893.1 EscF/YscF/HrpA family type III secretion system needle majo